MKLRNIEGFCGNCKFQFNGCFELMRKENDSRCNEWQYKYQIKSKIKKVSYKIKHRLFKKHISVECGGYGDGECVYFKGINSLFDTADDLDCMYCCCCKDNIDLKGKFNPLLEIVIK